MAGMPTSSYDTTTRDGSGLLDSEATPPSPAACMRGGIIPSSTVAALPTSSTDTTTRDGNGQIDSFITSINAKVHELGKFASWGLQTPSNSTDSSPDTATRYKDDQVQSLVTDIETCLRELGRVSGIHRVASGLGRSPLPTTGPGITRVNASLATVGQKLEELGNFAERHKEGNMRVKATTMGSNAKEANENAKVLGEMVKSWTEDDQSRASALAELDEQIVIKRGQLESVKENHESTVRQLQSDETALNSKLQKLQSDVSEEGQRMIETTRTLEQKTKSLDQVESRRTSLDREVGSLQLEVDGLRDAIDTKQQLHDRNEREHQEAQRQLETETAELVGKFDETRDSIKAEETRLGQLRVEIKEKERSIEKLRQQSQSEATQLEGELKKKQSDYNTLIYNCNTKQDDLTRLTQQAKEEQSKLDGLKHDTDVQSQKVDVNSKELKALEDDLQDKQLRLTQIQRHISLEEKERTALDSKKHQNQTQELQQARQQATDLENSLLNIELWLQDSLETYDNSAPTAAERITVNFKSLRNWYAKAMEKLARLEQQIKSDSINIQSVRELAEDRKRHLEQTEKERNDLKLKYDQLSATAAKDNKLVDKLQTGKSTLEGKMTELQKKLDQSIFRETQASLCETDWEGRKSLLKGQLDDLQKRERQLRQQVDTLSKTEKQLRDKLSRLQSKEEQWTDSRDKLKKANQDLKQEIKELTSRDKESNMDNRDNFQTIQKLIVVNSELARQVTNYQALKRTQNSSLVEKLRVLQEQNTNLTRRIKDAEEQDVNLTRRIEESEEQNTNLTRRIKEADAETQKTGHAVRTLVVVNSGLARQATNHQALERGWNDGRRSLEEDKVNLNRDLSRLLLDAEQHSGELQQQRTDLDGQIRSLKVKETEWSQEKSRMEKSRDDLHVQKGSLDERVKTLQEQNTNLGTQVSDLEKINKNSGLQLDQEKKKNQNLSISLTRFDETTKERDELKVRLTQERDQHRRKVEELERKVKSLQLATPQASSDPAEQRNATSENPRSGHEPPMTRDRNLGAFPASENPRAGHETPMTRDRTLGAFAASEHPRSDHETPMTRDRNLGAFPAFENPRSGPPITRDRSLGAFPTSEDPRAGHETPLTRKRKIGASSASLQGNRQSGSNQETPHRAVETPRTRVRNAADSTIPESGSSMRRSTSTQRSKRTKATSIPTDADPTGSELDVTPLPWAIEDVRLEDFSPESIPAERWAWVRDLMSGFDERRSKWTRATDAYGGPVCAINYSRKAPTDWVEGKFELGCTGCKKRRTPCIIVQDGRLDIVAMDN
ncbi:hypothetical protein G7Y79_00038g074630 [Physcia stellaris]|nr:hypothetical protein G7Y79_00038g074630 [Physcia stellaris]